MASKVIDKKTRKFFVETGRKGGNKLLAERGKDYFTKMVTERWRKHKEKQNAPKA